MRANIWNKRGVFIFGGLDGGLLFFMSVKERTSTAHTSIFCKQQYLEAFLMRETQYNNLFNACVPCVIHPETRIINRLSCLKLSVHRQCLWSHFLSTGNLCCLILWCSLRLVFNFSRKLLAAQFAQTHDFIASVSHMLGISCPAFTCNNKSINPPTLECISLPNS